MRLSVLLIALAIPGSARADWIAWTPIRVSLTGAIDVPTNSDYILGDIRLEAAQQVGGAHLDGETHRGSGPFAALGGFGSFGLYTPFNGATGCEDEVDPDDGSKRWTCGRIALGGTVTLGWSWGSLLKSGYMLPERSVYVQLAPFGAAVKRPDIDRTFELDVTGSLGYMWSWGGIAARWTRVPGDDYYGASLQLTRGFSDWFVDDEKVAPEARNPAPDPPVPWRFEVGVGGYGVVHGDHADSGAALFHLGVYYRTSREPYGPFTGIGGAVTLPLGDPDSGAIGPAVTFGLRGKHAGVYMRARPLIGARTFDGDTQFDYGIDGALGVSLTSPHLADEDGEKRETDNGLSLGLEVTSGWIAGDVILGGALQLIGF
jgi:hypothetical protein